MKSRKNNNNKKTKKKQKTKKKKPKKKNRSNKHIIVSKFFRLLRDKSVQSVLSKQSTSKCTLCTKRIMLSL